MGHFIRKNQQNTWENQQKQENPETSKTLRKHQQTNNHRHLQNVQKKGAQLTPTKRENILGKKEAVTITQHLENYKKKTGKYKSPEN